MRTVSTRLIDLGKTTIPIGFVGENMHTQVRIDCQRIYKEYPHAAASLTVKPPKGEPYPAVVTRENDTVVWDITDSDLIYEGSGKIQLSFTVGEVVAKSFIGWIRINKSIVPTGDVPDPIDDFLTRAGAALTAIPETIDTALEEAKESGEFDGEDGFSPVVTITEITGGHEVTITDAVGDHAFDVFDGEKGEKGDDGLTPDLSIGTVETLEPGNDATVTITGTTDKPVLNFGIPKGDPGEVTEAEFNELKSVVKEMSVVNHTLVIADYN